MTKDPEEEGLIHIGTEEPTRFVFMCDREEAYVSMTFHEREMRVNSLSDIPEYLVAKAAQMATSLKELKRQMETGEESDGQGRE